MTCPRSVLLFLVLLSVLAARSQAGGKPGGFPVCTVSGDQLEPFGVARTDPSSGAALMVIWQDRRRDPGDGGDLGFGVVSRAAPVVNLGPVEGALVVERPGLQFQQQATAVEPLGCPAKGDCESAILTYIDLAIDPQPERVRAARLVSGKPTWDVPVSTSPKLVVYPSVAGDGGPGAFVAWSELKDQESYRSRARVQHLSGNGARLWGDEGRFAVTDTVDQEVVQAAPDGSGGVYLVWLDYRFSDPPAIFAMHLDADGERASGWPAEGRLVAFNEGYPQ